VKPVGPNAGSPANTDKLSAHRMRHILLCGNAHREAVAHRSALFEPHDGDKFIYRNAWHVDGVLDRARVGVTNRHPAGDNLAVIDG
jgi:hypothetical protein